MMRPTGILDRARKAVHRLVRYGRGMFFKAFQVIEILRADRAEPGSIKFRDPDSYLPKARDLRDEVVAELVGRRTRSNMAWRDAWFYKSENHEILYTLARKNRRQPAVVEADVARRIMSTMAPLRALILGIDDDDAPFSARRFLTQCNSNVRLRRHQPVIFQLLAGAVCATIVDVLDVSVTVHTNSAVAGRLSADPIVCALISDLQPNGFTPPRRGRFERVGNVFAPDGGVDYITNFGPHVEVKHAPLDAGLARSIRTFTTASELVVVCQAVAPSYRKPAGANDQVDDVIRGTITRGDLLILSDRIAASEFGADAASTLTTRLSAELRDAFPLAAPGNLEGWMRRRGYDTAPVWPLPKPPHRNRRRIRVRRGVLR